MAKEEFRKSDTYKVLAGTSNMGHKYEWTMSAFVALKLCLSDHFKQFKIASNVSNFGKFDDLVIEQEHDNGDYELIAVQLKHGDGNISKGDLVRNDGKLNPIIYFKSLNEAAFAIDNSSKFILYTNRSIKDIITEQKQKFTLDFSANKKKDNTLEIDAAIILEKTVLPQSDNLNNLIRNVDDIYKFSIETENEKVAESAEFLKYKNFFQQLYLCTDQGNADVVENELKQIFVNKLHCCSKHVVEDYLKYFEMWWQNKNINFKLTDFHIYIKLAEILFQKYIKMIPFNSEEVAENKSSLLTSAIMKFTTTICEEDTEEICKIWNKSFENSKQIEELKRILQLGNYNNEEYEKTLLSWVLCQTPLIIKSDDTNKEQIQKFVSLSQKRFNYKFVIIDTTNDKKFKNTNNNFCNLQDLEIDQDIYQKIIELFTFKTEGRGPFTIQEFLNKHKEISLEFKVHHLLKMLNDNLNFGNLLDLPVVYMPRKIYKVLYEWSTIETIQDVLIIVGKCKPYDCSQFNSQKQYKPLNWVLKNKNHKNNYFAYTADSITDFQQIKEKFNKFHYFEFTEGTTLEWIVSYNSQLNLVGQRASYDKFIKDTELINYFRNSTNIILADPGNGKSILLTFLHQNCPLSFWPLKINIREHFEFFVNEIHDCDEIIDYIFEKCEQNQLLSKLKHYYRKTKSLLFLWDGIDEILSQHLDKFIEKVKVLEESGYKQILASRKHLLQQFLDNFHMCPLYMINFHITEQLLYLKQRLEPFFTDQDDQKLVKRELNKIVLTGILSIPLVLHLFCEIFLNRFSLRQNILSENILTTASIYKEFVDGKLKAYLAKGKQDAWTKCLEETRFIKTLENCQLAAAVALFGHEFCRKYKLKVPDQFLNEIEEDGFRHGIIINVTKERLPIFFHQTAAEYLFAQYLAKNYSKDKLVKEIIGELYKLEYRSLNYFFDLMLSKNHKNHTLLYIEQYDKLLEDKKINWNELDDGGRTLLHVACKMGIPHPNFKFKWDNSPYYLRGTEKYNCQRNEIYIELFNLLVENCDANLIDKVLNWNCTQYADHALALYEIQVLISKKKLKFKSLSFCKNVDYVTHYCNFCNNHLNLFNEFNFEEIINKQNEDVLISAAADGTVPFFNMLIEKWQKTSKENSLITVFQESLVTASKYNKLEIVNLILNRILNIDVNFLANKDVNDIAIHFSEHENNLGNVSHLLPNKLSIETFSSLGQSSLTIACWGNYIDIVKVLLAHPSINTNLFNKHGESALHLASFRNNVEIVGLLLKNKADCNLFNGLESTPLMATAVNGCKECAQILLENSKIKVNLKNNLRQTALHLACLHNRLEIVRLLLGHSDIKINLLDNNRSNALHIACNNNNLEIIQLLINNGCNVKAANKSKETPLSIAIKKGYKEAIQILTENRIK